MFLKKKVIKQGWQGRREMMMVSCQFHAIGKHERIYQCSHVTITFFSIMHTEKGR